MATAPKVQTIAEAMAELNPAYADSQAVVQKRQAGLGAKYDAQRAAIHAEKGQGFIDINNQATGRGGSFSGVPVHEQSRYLATKVLPGLMQADYQQNDEDLTLQGQIADMGKEMRLGAIGRIDQQTSALNSWNLAQQQMEAQRIEAENNRRFQAEQNQLNRSHESSMAAASRASSASSSQVNAYDTVETILQNGMGTDNKVSPTVWRQAAAYAHRNGIKFGGSDGFANRFWQYANDKHWQDYQKGYEKYM